MTAPMMEVASGDGNSQLVHRPLVYSEMKEASRQLPRVQDGGVIYVEHFDWFSANSSDPQPLKWDDCWILDYPTAEIRLTKPSLDEAKNIAYRLVKIETLFPRKLTGHIIDRVHTRTWWQSNRLPEQTRWASWNPQRSDEARCDGTIAFHHPMGSEYQK